MNNIQDKLKLIIEHRRFFIGLVIFFILFLSWLMARGG